MAVDVRDREMLRSSSMRAPVRRWLTRFGPYLAVVLAVAVANGAYLSRSVIASTVVRRAGLGYFPTTGILPGGYTIDWNDGYTRHALGAQAARQLLDGQLPWWNPYQGLGAPLTAEMQSAAFLPNTLLLALPAGGMLLMQMSFSVIAGWSTVALLRRLDIRPSIAAAGGVVFALNGVLAWFQHAAANPVAFLPVLIWGIERARSRALDGRPGGVLVVAAGIALSLVAGFPETAYIDGLLALLWAGVRLGQLERARGRFAGKVVFGGAVGVLLSTVATIPLLDHVIGGAAVGSHSGGKFASLGLDFHALGMLVTPYAYGPISAFTQAERGGSTLSEIWGWVGGYTTAAVVLLAVVGLVQRRLRALRVALLAWIVVALASTFAVPVLGDVLDVLPAMADTAFFRYAGATWIFALVVPAALGLEDVARGTVSRRWVVGATAGTLLTTAVLGGVAADLVGRIDDNRIEPYFRVSYGWAVASVVVVGACLWVVQGHRSRVPLAIVAVLVSVEAVVAFGLPSLSSPRQWARDADVEQLAEDVAAGRDGGDPFGRVYGLTSPMLAPNYGSYYGFGQLNVNASPTSGEWVEFVERELDENADGQHFLTATHDPAVLEGKIDAFVENIDGYRAASVEWVLTQPGPLDPRLTEVLEPVTYARTATISRLVGAEPYIAAVGEACAITSVSRTEHWLECDEAGTVVRREQMLDGWVARIDGEPVSVQERDAFQAVAVPAGRHRLVFSYAPPHVTLIAISMALGAVLATGSLVHRMHAARIRRRAAGSRAVPTEGSVAGVESVSDG